MFTEKYPVFAVLEDENGNVVEHFTICGCHTNGEEMTLRLKKN